MLGAGSGAELVCGGGDAVTCPGPFALRSRPRSGVPAPGPGGFRTCLNYATGASTTRDSPWDYEVVITWRLFTSIVVLGRVVGKSGTSKKGYGFLRNPLI
jgi:hypothetical protein